MLNFELKRTGYQKHCVLTGPMGSIVRIEFSSSNCGRKALDMQFFKCAPDVVVHCVHAQAYIVGRRLDRHPFGNASQDLDFPLGRLDWDARGQLSGAAGGAR